MNISKFHFITHEKNNLSHLESIKKACENGINWIQLRIKNKSYTEIENISIKALEICRKYNSQLIINDYWEIAKNINADGVHLGLDDEKIDLVRNKTNETFIIGGTANTLEDIIIQYKRGSNYIGLGALRNTSTKIIQKPLISLDKYKNIIDNLNKLNIKIPIIAIGGINKNDLKTLKNIGIYGIAVSSLIIDSNFDKKIISNIKDIFTF